MKNTKGERERFITAFATLCEVLGKEISKLGTEAYFKLLEQFTIEEVEAGITRALAECKFFPKPIELIGFMKRPECPIDDIATTQALVVIMAIRTVGFYGEPVFDDPITNELIKSRWTWKALCSLLEKELVFFERNFIESYKTATKNIELLAYDQRNHRALSWGKKLNPVKQITASPEA
jgi:hypothetical protein